MPTLSEEEPKTNGHKIENGENVSDLWESKEIGHQINYGTDERRVLVIYTGGTIGMVDNPDGFLIPQKNVFENLIRQFPQLHDNVFWEKKVMDDPAFDSSFLILPKTRKMQSRIYYQIFEYEVLLDSSNMTESDWIKIAKDIQFYYEQYDGFVVLHGTDTLCYTASALSFMFENIGKGVVLTGSQIPIFEPRSDGVDNLLLSLLVAGGLNIPEVTIYFGTKLFRGNRTRKISTNNLYAFNSPNCVPLVEVGIGLNVNKAAVFKPTVIEKFNVHAKMSKNVGLLRIFPSISTAVVKAFCQPPIEGVVLETYGAGNIPSNRSDLLDVLKEAMKRGVIMVIITQCNTGAVTALYETGKILAEHGVVSGCDMTPEAALTKLSYVLTKTELSYKEKTEMMAMNIRGELTNMSSLAIEDQTLKEALGISLNLQSPKKLSEVTEKVISSLLLYGIETDDLGVVKKLLEMGADVNSQGSDGKTPLHEAILKGNLLIIEYLLKSGSSVHIKRSSGESPLITAVSKDDSSTISLLMRCGAHLSAADTKTVTEMMTMAIKNNSLRRVESLAQAGADLDSPDELMQTPLHKAVLYNSSDIAQYLMINGADNQRIDILGSTPIDYAIKLNREILVDIVGSNNDSRRQSPNIANLRLSGTNLRRSSHDVSSLRVPSDILNVRRGSHDASNFRMSFDVSNLRVPADANLRRTSHDVLNLRVPFIRSGSPDVTNLRRCSISPGQASEDGKIEEQSRVDQNTCMIM